MDRVGMTVSALVAGAVMIFLLAPIIVVLGISVSPSRIFDFPTPGFSWQWYERLWSLRGFWSALGLSAQIAALSTLASLVMGTLCAIAIVRGRFPGRDALATFLASPLMLPGIVFGIAVVTAMRGIGLRDAWLSLIVAHIVVTMPFVMRTVLASLSLFDFTMIDAARTLGCPYPMALMKVLIPNIAPGVLSGGLFAFVASFDNYPVSMFLSDARTKTLPIQMIQYLGESPDPTLAAISAVLIAMTTVVLLVCDRLVGLRRLADV
jgi:putative spermidine/putrescine transport system permease protein